MRLTSSQDYHFLSEYLFFAEGLFQLTSLEENAYGNRREPLPIKSFELQVFISFSSI